ncbi:MAG: YafY family protein [Paracoccaceae bacterium]
MFEIIQLLRSATKPLTAREIAEVVEVTQRTVYRDIASLQAMRVPIEGAAGVGYVMQRGYDLPPINFDIEEAEAISVGLSMISRTGDKGLERAAQRAVRKLSEATEVSKSLFSSSWGSEVPKNVDLSEIRDAIREEVKLRLRYQDVADSQTERTVQPIALIYYAEAIVIVAWCELREDFRHFRADRVLSSDRMSEKFTKTGEELRNQWSKLNGTEF